MKFHCLESLSVIMPTTAGLQLSPKQQLQEQNIFQASQVFFDSPTSTALRPRQAIIHLLSS